MDLKSLILSYYKTNRKVGHTFAIQNIENVTIIIGDNCPLKFKSKTVKLSEFEYYMRGASSPIIFDNSAIIQLLQDL